MYFRDFPHPVSIGTWGKDKNSFRSFFDRMVKSPVPITSHFRPLRPLTLVIDNILRPTTFFLLITAQFNSDSRGKSVAHIYK